MTQLLFAILESCGSVARRPAGQAVILVSQPGCAHGHDQKLLNWAGTFQYHHDILVLHPHNPGRHLRPDQNQLLLLPQVSDVTKLHAFETKTFSPKQIAHEKILTRQEKHFRMSRWT
ncbi:hypothetical protein C4D60_Mb03t19570 [Musa balbisiana]|uniref:Uncharacterized protein n=1 Tax=Musa balbisiana TaxID=52838 RepID=A0A4S8JB49_MUSBA|nr:hypothetical protein C4D60_Mb03t19570 [Musa balbisiana]